MVKGIKYAVGKNYSCYYTGVMLYGELQAHLGDLEIPQAIRMDWDTGGGHVVVIEGYTKSRGIKLVDPGYKCSKATYYYTALVNGTTIQSGTGNYSQTFVIE